MFYIEYDIIDNALPVVEHLINEGIDSFKTASRPSNLNTVIQIEFQSKKQALEYIIKAPPSLPNIFSKSELPRFQFVEVVESVADYDPYTNERIGVRQAKSVRAIQLY